MELHPKSWSLKSLLLIQSMQSLNEVWKVCYLTTLLKLSGADGNGANIKAIKIVINIKAIKIVIAEISKEVPTKFKIHRTYYTLVQSILPALIFCLAKTFLRIDKQCLKHIDHDLMISWTQVMLLVGPIRPRRNNDHGDRALWSKIAAVIFTLPTPG